MCQTITFAHIDNLALLLPPHTCSVFHLGMFSMIHHCPQGSGAGEEARVFAEFIPQMVWVAVAGSSSLMVRPWLPLCLSPWACWFMINRQSPVPHLSSTLSPSPNLFFQHVPFLCLSPFFIILQISVRGHNLITYFFFFSGHQSS